MFEYMYKTCFEYLCLSTCIEYALSIENTFATARRMMSAKLQGETMQMQPQMLENETKSTKNTKLEKKGYLKNL